MLSPFEDRLSTVRRWAIVRTIQQQSVAEHSFRVALIAPRIAIKYFNVNDEAMLYRITRYAMLHDQREAFYGDTPRPVKMRYPEMRFDVGYEEKVREEPEEWGCVKQVVKIADCYEALHFLYVDQMMGNNTLTRIILDVWEAMKKACGGECDLYHMIAHDLKTSMEWSQDPLDVV